MQSPEGGPTRPERSNNAVNSLIHLYRAEVGRMAMYRQRLDTTTNWAITSSALLATFALGNDEIPHTAFLFLMLVELFFLVLEGRRFVVYEAARFRVLLLEHDFFPEMLGEPVPPDWTRTLVEALRTPSAYPSVSLLGAIGWRLRRTHLWVYLVILGLWIAKLDIAGSPLQEPVLADLVARAAVGSVPGWLVWLAVVAAYIVLILIAAGAPRTYPLGSEGARSALSPEQD